MMSASDWPAARNLLIVSIIVFMPPFMLLVCRSVEIESGTKPALIIGIAATHLKLPPPWPDVELHAALAALDHRRARSLRDFVVFAAHAAVHVREDVARPEILGDELHDRPAHLLVAAEIHHDGDVGHLADFLGAFVGRPLRSGKVGALDADDRALVLHRHRRGLLDLHVGDALLELSLAHAEADDVEEGDDAGLRTGR